MSDKLPDQSDSKIVDSKLTDQSMEVAESASNPSRRKFAKASVIAPALLTVGARPAFANMCSISGGGSPGSNQQQPDACLGCTPGFWKRNVHAWPNVVDAGVDGVDGVEPAEGSCTPMSTGSSSSTCKVYFNDGTRFNDVFTNGHAQLMSGVTAGTVELDSNGDVVENSMVDGDYFVQVNSSGTPILGHSDISLMQVLWLEKSAANIPVGTAVAFHLAAAFLNAMTFPFEYGYDPADIIALYENAVAGSFPDGITNFEGLKNVLDAMNNRGCPLSGNANQ